MSIKIFYGPYEAHGIIRHKIQRILALFWKLEELGYLVDLIPTRILETVTIEMKGKEIYRFNITNLMFGGEYEDDPIAQKVVEVIEEHKTRFDSEYNMPFYKIPEMLDVVLPGTDLTNLGSLIWGDQLSASSLIKLVGRVSSSISQTSYVRTGVAAERKTKLLMEAQEEKDEDYF